MKRVLVVDADKEARLEFSSLLGNYEVESVETIDEAFKRIKENFFDCVILDVSIEGFQGYKAVPIIRTLSPKTEVIATARENSKELEVKVREQDIFYYYIKTFGVEELKLAVRNIFRKHGKE